MRHPLAGSVRQQSEYASISGCYFKMLHNGFALFCLEWQLSLNINGVILKGCIVGDRCARLGMPFNIKVEIGEVVCVQKG